jgi:hypothetical protein
VHRRFHSTEQQVSTSGVTPFSVCGVAPTHMLTLTAHFLIYKTTLLIPVTKRNKVNKAMWDTQTYSVLQLCGVGVHLLWLYQ